MMQIHALFPHKTAMRDQALFSQLDVGLQKQQPHPIKSKRHRLRACSRGDIYIFRVISLDVFPLLAQPLSTWFPLEYWSEQSVFFSANPLFLVFYQFVLDFSVAFKSILLWLLWYWFASGRLWPAQGFFFFFLLLLHITFTYPSTFFWHGDCSLNLNLFISYVI